VKREDNKVKSEANKVKSEDSKVKKQGNKGSSNAGKSARAPKTKTEVCLPVVPSRASHTHTHSRHLSTC
jgi:hypothetical protein